MSKAYLFLADGHEEIEALTQVDLLRRAGIETVMVSIEGRTEVTGSHGISVKADALLEEICEDADCYILPGGMPGTKRLDACTKLTDMVRRAFEEGKLVAAICAAPSVFGHMGIADGRKVTSYPGFEADLPNSEYVTERVVVDGNMVTSRGMGTAFDMGLTLVTLLKDRDTADKLAAGTMYL